MFMQKPLLLLQQGARRMGQLSMWLASLLTGAQRTPSHARSVMDIWPDSESLK